MAIFDICRFVAALLVYLVHFKLIFAHSPIIPDVLATSAVSWFFMTSGFILSYKYHEIKLTWLEITKFYLARIARIYPGYIFSLSIAAIFTGVGYYLYGEHFFNYTNRPQLATYNYPNIFTTEDFIRAFISNSLFLQLFQDNFSRFLFNPPMWSLANEILFYLFFPILILLIKKTQPKYNLLILIICSLLLEYILIQLFSPAYKQLNWVNSNFLIYSNPLIRCTEFIIGMLIFFHYNLFAKNNKISMYKKCVYLGTIILIYIIAILFNTKIPYELHLFYYLTPIIAIMVWLMATLEWIPHSSNFLFLSKILGESSFTIYCFHWPILEIAHALKIENWINSPIAIATFLFLLIFFVGFLFSYYVERPIRKFAKSYHSNIV